MSSHSSENVASSSSSSSSSSLITTSVSSMPLTPVRNPSLEVKSIRSVFGLSSSSSSSSYSSSSMSSMSSSSLASFHVASASNPPSLSKSAVPPSIVTRQATMRRAPNRIPPNAMCIRTASGPSMSSGSGGCSAVTPSRLSSPPSSTIAMGKGMTSTTDTVLRRRFYAMVANFDALLSTVEAWAYQIHKDPNPQITQSFLSAVQVCRQRGFQQLDVPNRDYHLEAPECKGI